MHLLVLTKKVPNGSSTSCLAALCSRDSQTLAAFEPPGGLVKAQIAGLLPPPLHPERFLSIRRRVQPLTLHFQQVPT